MLKWFGIDSKFENSQLLGVTVLTITWVVQKVLTPTKGHAVGALEFKYKLKSGRGMGEVNLNEFRVVSSFKLNYYIFAIFLTLPLHFSILDDSFPKDILS